MPSHSSPAQVRQITVDEESAGQRLDNFLIRVLKGVPKSHIYRIIRSGEVRRNKGRVGADERVAAGDLLRIPPIRLSERAEERPPIRHRRANFPSFTRMNGFSRWTSRPVSRSMEAAA